MNSCQQHEGATVTWEEGECPVCGLFARMVRLVRLVRHLGERRSDPSCAACGGLGSEVDGSTCDCVGWYPRIDPARLARIKREAAAEAFEDAANEMKAEARDLQLGAIIDRGHLSGTPAYNVAMAIVGEFHARAAALREDPDHD